MSDRYHRHPIGDLCRNHSCTVGTPVVVLDPADLPAGMGDVERLRGYARELRDEDFMRPAQLLSYLAMALEQQTSPPVAEPVGLGAVVRDGIGHTWVRRTDECVTEPACRKTHHHAPHNGMATTNPEPWCKGVPLPWAPSETSMPSVGWRDLPRPVTVLAEGWTEGA